MRGQHIEQRRSAFDVFATDPVHDAFTLACQGDERRPAIPRMAGAADQAFVLKGVDKPGDGPSCRSEIINKITHDGRMRMVSQSRQQPHTSRTHTIETDSGLKIAHPGWPKTNKSIKNTLAQRALRFTTVSYILVTHETNRYWFHNHWWYCYLRQHA